MRINLIPLHRLRRKAERLVTEETNEVVTDAGGDDVESVIRSLDSLTNVLVHRNRQLTEQRAGLKISSVAFESQQAMVITNAEFEVLKVDKAFSESTGFGGDEIIGRTLDVLKSLLLERSQRLLSSRLSGIQASGRENSRIGARMGNVPGVVACFRSERRPRPRHSFRCLDDRPDDRSENRADDT